MQPKKLSVNQQKRRDKALAELTCLATKIQTRNRDLTAVAAKGYADRFTRAVIEELIVEGKIAYKRQ